MQLTIKYSWLVSHMLNIRITLVTAVMAVAGHAGAATLALDEDWATNTDSALWGSNWSTGLTTVTPSFLPTTIGGNNSGQATGNFERQFRNNSVGIATKTETYHVQAAVQIGEPSPGQDGRMKLLLIDGANPTTSAATFGFSLSINGNLNFFAIGGGGEVDLEQDNGDPLVANFDTTYVYDLTVNPVAKTFDVLVTELDSSGIAVASAGLTGVSSADQNIFNNNGNGILRFENTTQNTQLTRLDRITISDEPIDFLAVPEPSTALIFMANLFFIFRRRR